MKTIKTRKRDRQERHRDGGGKPFPTPASFYATMIA